ncbi:MAG: hypothetical protein ABI091_21885 [Ferruginibacter sp.]
MAFAKIALDIALLDELKEVAPYKEDDDVQFNRGILKTMKDPIILVIDRFLDDSDIYITKLEEDNNFLDEELDDMAEHAIPGSVGDCNRSMFLKILAFYFEQHLTPQFTQSINELCELSNEIPLKDYRKADNFDDENIKAVAAFYVKCINLVDYLYDNNFFEEILPGERDSKMIQTDE